MTKNPIGNYLTTNSKTLGSLLTRLNQQKQWQVWLQECLETEDNLVQHCQIIGIDRQALIVMVDSPHWVTRLRFHIPSLLVKLKNYPDFKEIKAICSKVHPQYTPVSPRKTKRKPLKISKKSADFILEQASKIDDPKLKASLERIAARGK